MADHTALMFVDKDSGKVIQLLTFMSYPTCPKCGKPLPSMAYVPDKGGIPEHIHCNCYACGFQYDMCVRS